MIPNSLETQARTVGAAYRDVIDLLAQLEETANAETPFLEDFVGSLRAAVEQRASDWCADNEVFDVSGLS